MAGANEALFSAVRIWVAENYPGANAAEVLIVLNTAARPVRLPVPLPLLAPPAKPVSHTDAHVFVTSPLQDDIIEALDGKALRKVPLAAAVGVDPRALYCHPGGMRELQEEGLVRKHPRLGYYDPLEPPPELAETAID